jgi:hypothetical protein
MVQGGFVRIAVACMCVLGLLLAPGAARGAIYFGATISGESYGETGHAPRNITAWDSFERHAGRRVAILNQGQNWLTWDAAAVEATQARGAIPLVTMGLGSATLADVVAGKEDAAIKAWAQKAKSWGHPFLFAPWWEVNGTWYAWGRSPDFIAAWRHFHDLVAAAGATNVTWTWVVNSVWSDPASDPTPFYPGDSYVDWTGLDSYNWGRNPAQPDRWTTPEQTFSPTLKIIRDAAPAKPVAIIETAASELGGNKTNWIREALTTYLPHHPEVKAFLWFNWPFEKNGKRSDWPIETSAPAQQQFRKAIQGSAFAGGPVSLPSLTKVPPPAAAAADPAQAEDVSPAAEMASGADVDVAPDGTATIVWSARGGGEWTVFGRRIAADGSRGPVRQLSAAGGDAVDPRVAAGPDGTAVVTWTRWDGSNFRVQERRIAPSGVPEEATRTLSGSGQNAAAPEVDVAPDGRATVVWRRWDGFHYLAQVRQIAPDGSSEGSAQRLSETGQDAVEPQVAVAPDGTATAVWSRFDGEDSIVQARRVGADEVIEPTGDNLSAAGESAVEPRLGIAPDGTATVVWDRFDGANWVIQSRRISAAGVPAATTLALSAAGRSAAEPQLALDSDGSATVVWDRFDTTGSIVQARRLDPAGNPVLGPLDLSAPGADAADPQLASAPDGTATVLWSRFDGSRWRLQRRTVAGSGSVGAVTTLSAAGRDAGDPALAWGDDGTLMMSWRRSAGGGDVIQVKSVPGPDSPPPPPPPPPAPAGGGSVDSGGSSGAGAGGGGDGAAAPADSFRIADVRLDRRHGTARITVEVPGPGTVALAGVMPQRREAERAGEVTLPVLPRRGSRRLLERRGWVRVRLTVTFVPGGGPPSSRGLSLRLKKG